MGQCHALLTRHPRVIECVGVLVFTIALSANNYADATTILSLPDLGTSGYAGASGGTLSSFSYYYSSGPLLAESTSSFGTDSNEANAAGVANIGAVPVAKSSASVIGASTAVGASAQTVLSYQMEVLGPQTSTPVSVPIFVLSSGLGCISESPNAVSEAQIALTFAVNPFGENSIIDDHSDLTMQNGDITGFDYSGNSVAGVAGQTATINEDASYEFYANTVYDIQLT